MKHQEDKQSKATSSLFTIEMVAKLEWTQSKAQQSIEKLTESYNVCINQQRINNNRTTAFEQTAAKATGGLNAFYWYQIFALDSAVVEAQKCWSRVNAGVIPDYSKNNDIKCKYGETFNSNHAAQTQEP